MVRKSLYKGIASALGKKVVRQLLGPGIQSHGLLSILLRMKLLARYPPLSFFFLWKENRFGFFWGRVLIGMVNLINVV